MSKPIVIAPVHTYDFESVKATSDRVPDDKPEMRTRALARSHDRTAQVVVWDCTAGRFDWYYNTDETIVVLSGEAFITNEKGEEKRISSGDVVFFPAGASSKWHVPNYIKKVAFLRQSLPRPIGFGVRAWHRLRRIIHPRTGGLMMLTQFLCSEAL